MSEKSRKSNTGRIVILVEAAVAAIIIVALFFSSMYTVSEQEQAVITQFGKAYGESGAGLHFRIPIIQNVKKVDITTRGMELGYLSSGSGSYSGSDYTNVESESFMITKDFNFVTIDFYIEWKVTHATKFLYNSNDPETLLRNILQSEARSIVSTFNVDDVLTVAKPEIQSRMKEAVLEKLAHYDLGLTVLNIAIQDAQPPTDYVISAFKDVENAKQGKETEINGANRYYNEILPEARAESDKIVKAAEAIKESRINEANGQVARFNEMYKEYINNKSVTKMRMYLETMEEILPGIKVYITEPGTGDTLKVLNIGGDSNSDGNANFNEGGAAIE